MRIASLLLAAPLLAACATAGTPPLARVNGDAITGADLKREFARHHMALDKIIGDEAEVRKYLERVIDRRLLIQEARRMALQDRPDVRELVEAQRGERMRQILLKSDVEEKAIVSDEAVKAIYDQYQAALEVRQLVVATEAEAVELRQKLADGADFEKLAREKSLAPSTVQGGLTLVTWGGDAAREKVLFALAERELSQPWKSELGWEVDRLERKVPPKEAPPFAKLAPRIRGVLERRAKTALRADLIADLRKRLEARILDCPVRPAELRAVEEAKDPDAKALAERPCATWTGGALTMRQIAARVVVDQLEKVPEAKREATGRQAVSDLLDEQLLVVEARARGYDRRPEVLEDAQAKEDDLVEDLLLSQHVLAGITVTDEEVKAWYDAHPGDFVEPARYRLAQIVVDSKEKADEVLKRLAANQPFEELAKELSRDTRTAARGGVVGELTERELKGKFDAVLALKPGEVSPPIPSPNGLHLVKVVGLVPERQLPFEEAKPAVQRAVLQPRVEERSKKWLGTLRASARIEVSEKGIRAYSRQKGEELKANEASAAERKAKGATRHGGEMSTGLGEAPAAPAPSAAGGAQVAPPASPTPPAPAPPAPAPGH
jgi:parvulin-like peptidyl-prolyl isomerase